MLELEIYFSENSDRAEISQRFPFPNQLLVSIGTESILKGISEQTVTTVFNNRIIMGY